MLSEADRARIRRRWLTQSWLWLAGGYGGAMLVFAVWQTLQDGEGWLAALVMGGVSVLCGALYASIMLRWFCFLLRRSRRSVPRRSAQDPSVIEIRRAGGGPVLARVSGKSLAGANLSAALLRRASLFGADLQRASLAQADLRGADLAEALLDGADLRGADLRGAMLVGTSLRGADLRGADLGGLRTGMRGLSESDLTGARWDATTRWPPGFNPRRAVERSRASEVAPAVGPEGGQGEVAPVSPGAVPEPPR